MGDFRRGKEGETEIRHQRSVRKRGRWSVPVVSSPWSVVSKRKKQRAGQAVIRSWFVKTPGPVCGQLSCYCLNVRLNTLEKKIFHSLNLLSGNALWIVTLSPNVTTLRMRLSSSTNLAQKRYLKTRYTHSSFYS